MKIGISFSGGGYRASSFSLGTLTYLDRLQLEGKSLLQHVVVLSTASGGTISGARYAVGLKRGESFEEVFSALYNFLSVQDLPKESVKLLRQRQNGPSNRALSLISVFGDLYDKFLFDGELFGRLMDDDVEPETSLNCVSFNATEFSSGNQFRFQWSEPRINPFENEPSRGIIGNYYYRIQHEAAKKIRMGDVLAASSCFPGGFEPINFPTDFGLDQRNLLELNDLGEQPVMSPIGLMDGGVADNQAVKPLLLANDRMKSNRYGDEVDENGKRISQEAIAKKPNELDLILISDVCSHYMDSYKAARHAELKGWRNISLFQLGVINGLSMVAAIVGLILGLVNDISVLMIASSSLLTINLAVFGVQMIGLYFLLKKPKPSEYDEPIPSESQSENNSEGIGSLIRPLLRDLFSIKLGTLISFLDNRINSVLKLTGEVFMKVIRRDRYDSLYDDPTWKNRLVANLIYELRPGEEKLKKDLNSDKIAPVLKPSVAIQEISTIASNMATTLWFTQSEKKTGLLDKVIACGQYNTCWNLLVYIQSLKKDLAKEGATLEGNNLNEQHLSLLTLEPFLLDDWARFQKNPLWMIDEMKKAFS